MRFQKDLFLQALFLSTLPLYFYLLASDFTLDELSRVVISQASVEGVDVAARISTFIRGLLMGAILFPLFYLGLERYWRTRSDDRQFCVPTLVAFAGLAVILLDPFIGRSMVPVLWLCLFLYLALTFLFFFVRRSRFFDRIFSFPAFFWPYQACIGILIYGLLLFLFNSAPFFFHNSTILFGVCLLLAFFGLLLARKYSSLSLRRLYHRSLPLIFVPFLVFLSIELRFLFFENSSDIFLHRWIFFGGLLLLCSLFILWRRKSRSLLPARSLLRSYAWASLATIILLGLYEPLISQPSEFFELANPANSQMRTFAFGETPLIDFFSSHLLSEQFYGFFYHGLHGYEGGLDFLTWRFFSQAIFYAIVCFFLSKLFRSTFLAFFFVLLFPFVHTFFFGWIFPGVLALFFVRRSLVKESALHYGAFFAFLAFLLVWRLDAGVATLFASVVFWPLSFYIEGERIHLFKALKGFAALLCGGLAVLLLLFLFHSPIEVWEALLNAYHYGSAEQAHGLAKLTEGAKEHPFYLYYILFPAFSLFAVFFIALKGRNEGLFQGKGAFALHASLLLFLLHLANFQRGLVRHHFGAGHEFVLASTFFVALALFFYAFIRPKVRGPSWDPILFFALALGLLLAFKHFPLKKDDALIARSLAAPTLQKFDKRLKKKNYEGRVEPDSSFIEKNYDETRAFLDRELREEQTFLDFSNSPMLYFYTGRRVPSYFCQSLQNTVDDHLQWDHLDRIELSKVPVVVHSHYPPNWFDRTDGVPNAMRYYWIAEFVYANYRPWGVLDGRSIWLSKGFDVSEDPEQADTLNQQAKIHPNGKAPAYLDGHFFPERKGSLRLLERSSPDPIGRCEGCFRSMIPDEAASSNSLWLRVILEEAGMGKEHRIDILGEEKRIGSESFQSIQGHRSYLIRLSEHFLWHLEEPSELRIGMNGGEEIRRVEYYEDERYEH